MRPAVLLAQLALCASTVHAFFPYSPKWRNNLSDKKSDASDKRSIAGQDDGSVRMNIRQRTPKSKRPLSERAAFEAVRLVNKYSRRQPSNDVLTKRQNGYEVMEAEESDGKFAQGVDQDGTDYSYFVEVQIGSEGKTMYMLIDTGAGSSWVMGHSCTSEACGLHNTFGPDDSKSLETTDKKFSIAYGSGKVSGLLARDTITVAGMDIEYQFGLADTTSDQFLQFAFDGILGLAMNKGANENFLASVEAADVLDKNIFCIALNRASDGSNEGEISFGSPNEDKYTGKISYTSLGEGDEWAIKNDDMGYNGKKAGIGGLRSYIDTGTSFMFGPADAVEKLHSIIPGAKSTDGTTYTVPCDSNGDLTVTFSGVDYTISSKDWVSPKNKAGECTSNVYGYEVVEGAWLLGDTFIKNVYTVFDKDSRRIGFATNAITNNSGDDDDSLTTSSSGSSQASSTKIDSVSSTSTSTSSSSSTGSNTGISVVPTDTSETGKPDVGLGQETIPTGTTGTATEDASEATDTQDSDSGAPPGPLSQARYTFILCLLPMLGLIV